MDRPEVEIFYWSGRRLGIGRREWRWHAVDTSNGEKLAGSLEGYYNLAEMLRTLDKLRRTFPTVRVTHSS